MAKTKKTTATETAAKTEPKKKTTKKSKKKQEVVETNPVDKFIEDNEGKLLEAPASDDEVLPSDNMSDVDIEIIADSPEIVEAEIVEVDTRKPHEESGQENKVNVIGVGVTTEPAHKPDKKSENSRDEVALEADDDSLKQIFEKFKEASETAKIDNTNVVKIGKNAIYVNKEQQPEKTNVHKIPPEKTEKPKKSFLNRVFTAMGLRQD